MNLICYRFCCRFCIHFLNVGLFQTFENDQAYKQGDSLCVDQQLGFLLLPILNIFRTDLWVKVKLKWNFFWSGVGGGGGREGSTPLPASG